MESSRRLRPHLIALNKIQCVRAVFSPLARDVRPTDAARRGIVRALAGRVLDVVLVLEVRARAAVRRVRAESQGSGAGLREAVDDDGASLSIIEGSLEGTSVAVDEVALELVLLALLALLVDPDLCGNQKFTARSC